MVGGDRLDPQQVQWEYPLNQFSPPSLGIEFHPDLSDTLNACHCV